MDESARKKTMLAWQPPAAASRHADDTLIAPAAPPPPSPAATQVAPVAPPAPAVSAPIATPAPEAAVPHAATQVAPSVPAQHSRVRPAEHMQATIPAQVEPLPPQSATTPLGPGSVIGGRYVIKELAGEGGFAAVYRAVDSEIPSHEVAVKVLKAKSDDAIAQASALRELTLIASVSHPSVVQFKDYGWHEGRLFFAMPWYRGRTLASSSLPLDRASARRIFERCAYGLQAMHEAGICHYDIKPDNIFLADIAGFEAGFPVLLDLGIAAKRGETPVALTPEYASPETAAAIMDGGQTQVGTAADVFSLALSLRNVLEPDTAPVLGESLPGFLHQRAHEAIAAPSGKDLRYLEPSFKRWLSIDPLERPSAVEFAAELAQLTEPEERRADRRRMLLRAAPIVLVLGVLTTLLALALRSKTTELVQQKAIAARANAETNARFEELKQDSKNQLDEKLQLAQEFRSQRDVFEKQRDQTRVALTASEAASERVRGELSRRTRERDQARDSLQQQTTALEQTRLELTRRNQDLEARGRELADARERTAEKSEELARRTAERDRVQADLARRSAELENAVTRLQQANDRVEATRTELDRRTKERERVAADLKKTEAELDKLKDALSRRNKEIDGLEKDLKDVKRDLTARTAERDEARKALSRREAKPIMLPPPAAKP